MLKIWFIIFIVSDLERQIELLRDTQRKYSNILRLSRALASHFYHVVQTQVSNLNILFIFILFLKFQIYLYLQVFIFLIFKGLSLYNIDETFFY